ncbi:MAG TPA: hypothetical protein VFV84_04475 [Burkholderiales bacterium]|nr:hypothetical protein [Burkholderiales bacterium]
MRRPLAAWLALAAFAMQALWPLAAAATPLPSDVCTVAGSVPMPDPNAPACRLHCAACIAGAGQAAFPAPPSPPALRPAVPVLRVAERPAPPARSILAAAAAPARAPPAAS